MARGDSAATKGEPAGDPYMNKVRGATVKAVGLPLRGLTSPLTTKGEGIESSSTLSGTIACSSSTRAAGAPFKLHHWTNPNLIIAPELDPCSSLERGSANTNSTDSCSATRTAL